jgi:2-keto-4-pentenoate hydratase/2-oxohepta-3-ene-1,7-dioic acid hydratase in catechol pathway
VRLATIRTEGTTRAVRVDGDTLVDLGAADLGELLGHNGWAERARVAAAAGTTSYPAAGADYAPLVPRPSKVVCVGLNYRTHIQEMGRDLPEFPTLFAKFADTLTGANDDIVKPAETGKWDWEAELAVVIGAPARRAAGAQAEAAIAGFTVLNDITARDWQFRTKEWLQGKIWDSSTPVGPFLVTPDELPGGVRPALGLRLVVDGETVTAEIDGLGATVNKVVAQPLQQGAGRGPRVSGIWGVGGGRIGRRAGGRATRPRGRSVVHWSALRVPDVSRYMSPRAVAGDSTQSAT